MCRSRIDFMWVRIQNRWPQQCTTLFGHDSNIQLVKVRTTAILYIVQIKEYSQDSDPRLSGREAKNKEKRNTLDERSDTADALSQYSQPSAGHLPLDVEVNVIMMRHVVLAFFVAK